MDFDINQIAEYVRQADTEELLDRVTVYRDGMEPVAIDLMEGELSRRGVRYDDIVAHREQRRERVLMHDDGTAQRCAYCERPATCRRWRWFRLYGLIPLVPLLLRHCERHDPRPPTPDPDADLKDDEANPPR